MQPLTANRATIAGIGSTAALLAAVVAVSLIVGGLVAFTASPAGPLASAEPSLRLPASAAAQVRGGSVPDGPAPLVLPAAPPGLAAAGAGVGGSGGAGPSGGPAAEGRSGSLGGTGTGAATTGTGTGATPPATPPVAAVPDATAPTLPSALADTTAAAGNAVAGTLNQTIGGIGAVVAGVSPPLGQAVTGAGAGLGNGVTQTTDPLSGTLRRLGEG